MGLQIYEAPAGLLISPFGDFYVRSVFGFNLDQGAVVRVMQGGERKPWFEGFPVPFFKGLVATAERKHAIHLGLIGVEERVAAYRGTLEHHPTSEGGYQVEVVLPLPAPSS